MNFAARPLPPQNRAGDGRGRDALPLTVPADPYWVESARKAFLRHWHDEHGNAIDTATEAYGE